MKAGNDQWTIVELPAIALDNDQLRRPRGEALWPSHYPLEALARIRGNTLARYWMPPFSAPARGFVFLLALRHDPQGVLGKGPLQW
jgi:hypothetical protein